MDHSHDKSQHREDGPNLQLAGQKAGDEGRIPKKDQQSMIPLDQKRQGQEKQNHAHHCSAGHVRGCDQIPQNQGQRNGHGVSRQNSMNPKHLLQYQLAGTATIRASTFFWTLNKKRGSAS